jgi:hypothetical protein
MGSMIELKGILTMKHNKIAIRLVRSLLPLALLLGACTAPTQTPTPQPTATQSQHTEVAANPTVDATPIASLEPTPTTEAVPTTVTATTQPVSGGSPQLMLDSGSLSSGLQIETVAAVYASNETPFWEVLPEHTRVTLQGYPLSGYPLSNPPMQPHIYIYPVEELWKVNRDAGIIAESLKTLLQSPQEIPQMPFLPLVNAAQVMHAHIQYLDFKNGQGLRYLAEFSQGIEPVNNSGLVYTYQGLTSDGKYYVAAVLPVNHPSLPADGNIRGDEPPEFINDHAAYLTNVQWSINQQAASSFTPDLTLLDAMLSSLEIK